MPDIKVKGYSGNDLVYQNVDKVYFRKSDDSGTVPFSYGDAVSKTVEPDFSSGDMSVEIAEGELAKEMTIVKPEDLAPENIRAGKEIAGFTGEFIGDTEEATVDLNFVSISTEAMLENLSFTSTLDADFGYCHNPESQFDLVIGDTYRVVWDNEEFTCAGMDGSALIAGAILIGNGAPFELTGNGEPFVIGSVGGRLLIACVTDTEPTAHTVSLYHAAGSVSDMVIEPSEEGKVLSQVTIEKPADLLPENILKDKNIGGVGGTHECSGGGKQPYVFCYAKGDVYHARHSSSYERTHYGSYTVPAGTTIQWWAGATNGYYTASSTQNGSAALTLIKYGDHVTMVESTNGRYNMRYRPTWTERDYASSAAVFIVMFTIPGFYLIQDGDNKYILADDTTPDYLPAALTHPDGLLKADLSNSNITEIGYYAFQYAKIPEILLPGTVQTIGNKAFYDPNGVTVDFTKHTVVPTLSSNEVFCASSNLKIKVPSALLSQWKAAQYWSTFASYIVGV